MWKSKSDVQIMVNGAYLRMLGSDVISRLIIWGDLRSEEMVPVANVLGSLTEDLSEINLGNTQTDNQFSEWGSIYAVINRCNLVLDKAAAVMQEDPSYTQGDYLSDCSQMLALRSLCYFYLVRNFRDVPYITTSFTDSSQDRNIPQAAPDSVLAGCLNDLAIAEKNAIQATAFNDWRRVGYMTKDAINALQADIHLWLGSVKHNPADYEQAIAYCDKVIASKKGQHIKGRGEVEEKDYWIGEGKSAFPNLFIQKNAEESIFELQFDGSTNNNDGVANYFNHYNGNINAVPYLYASSIFIAGGEVFTSTNNANGAADWRGLMSTYNQSTAVGDFEGLEIRKYVSSNANYNPNNTGISNRETKSGVTQASTQGKNYIIYRLQDILLMKAEALMALAAGDDDTDHLIPAFELVRDINLVARESESFILQWNTFGPGGISSIESLILAERLRELCFEGKRWYDLLRFGYRHMEGVDYTTTLSNQNARGVAAVNTYDEMGNLMKRKLAGKGDAVAAKLSTEAKLYMPIPQSDIDICPALQQNPAYSAKETHNKNY